MNHYKTIILLSLSLSIFSCTSDSESDLGEDPLTETVTYTGTVKNIIDTNCLSCHGNPASGGASNSLDTYEKVKDAVLNRGLIDRISRAEGTGGAMPQGGPRLSQTAINQIKTWNNGGRLE